MKRALVFSALGSGSGAALRAAYFCNALRRQGWDARLHLPMIRNLPFSLEAFISMPWFALMAAWRRVDLAVGIKPYPNCWLALWIAQLRGALAVADVDDLDAAWRPGLAGDLAELVQAPAYKLLSRFSTHHPAIRLRLKGRGKIFELGQGVETKIFHTRPGRHEKLLVFTAHLNIACQLDCLISWVGPWLKKNPSWRLVVAGGGPGLNEFRKNYESAQIIFTGALSPRGAATWMGRASICLAAYAQGKGNAFRVPMKTGEYLAMARPVVCNYISGLAPLRKYLYLCKPNSAAFSFQLNRLCLGRGDGRERRGAAWVQRNMSWDAVASRFLRELI